jgi:hypothetical protein
LPPLPSRLLPGGANQFPGGSCTRCSPALFTAHYFANYGWFQVFKLSTRTKPLLRRTLRLWPQPGLIRSRARFAQPRTLIARNRARAPYSCDDNGAAANHHLILLHTVSSAFASSTWRNSLPSSTITKLRLRGTGLFGVLTMADPVQSGLTE